MTRAAKLASNDDRPQTAPPQKSGFRPDLVATDIRSHSALIETPLDLLPDAGVLAL